MKYFKRFFCFILCLVSICLLTACGSANVDYDLAADGDQATYVTVTNMKKSPNNYKNKTYRIRGKITKNSTLATLKGMDSTGCCPWDLKLKEGNDNIVFTTSQKNVIVIGEYKSYKVGGQTSWYLVVNEIE